MTNHDIFEMHAEFCKVFSDPKRLRIMWCLQKGERSVGDVARELGLTLSNVSQHLRMMYDRGAVTYRREGKTIIYRIANDKFIQGCLLIREGLMEQLHSRNEAASV
jgi:ArsR family transcriptional regulator, virulence genes transcriptional regulator